MLCLVVGRVQPNSQACACARLLQHRTLTKDALSRKKAPQLALPGSQKKSESQTEPVSKGSLSNQQAKDSHGNPNNTPLKQAKALLFGGKLASMDAVAIFGASLPASRKVESGEMVARK